MKNVDLPECRTLTVSEVNEYKKGKSQFYGMRHVAFMFDSDIFLNDDGKYYRIPHGAPKDFKKEKCLSTIEMMVWCSVLPCSSKVPEYELDIESVKKIDEDHWMTDEDYEYFRTEIERFVKPCYFSTPQEKYQRPFIFNFKAVLKGGEPFSFNAMWNLDLSDIKPEDFENDTFVYRFAVDEYNAWDNALNIASQEYGIWAKNQLKSVDVLCEQNILNTNAGDYIVLDDGDMYRLPRPKKN